MAKCNQCGKVISFSKNPAGKWIPFDKSGECHFVTCKGTPTKNSRKDLLNRIKELEEKLEKAEGKASSYYHYKRFLRSVEDLLAAEERATQAKRTR